MPIMPIINFRAFWNPTTHMFGIEISVQGGPQPNYLFPIASPEELRSLLTLLNGSSPILTPAPDGSGLVIVSKPSLL